MRLWDYMDQGGSIMYVLLVLNIIGLSLMFWRIFAIFAFRKNINSKAELVLNSVGKVDDQQLAVSLIKDEVSNTVQELETGLGTVKIIATISPLLGLLGTVVGIFMAFSVISQQGMSNPAQFAGGISLALLTTIAGLIVAIPHYIGHNYLSGLLDDIEVKLEQAAINKLIGKK